MDHWSAGTRSPRCALGCTSSYRPLHLRIWVWTGDRYLPVGILELPNSGLSDTRGVHGSHPGRRLTASMHL